MVQGCVCSVYEASGAEPTKYVRHKTEKAIETEDECQFQVSRDCTVCIGLQSQGSSRSHFTTAGVAVLGKQLHLLSFFIIYQCH